jgi:hypothetical protein
MRAGQPHFLLGRCEKDDAGALVCKFRQFNSDVFSHVVFSREELVYWRNDASADSIFPMTVLIKSKWESRTVLFKLPDTPHPAVAPRIEQSCKGIS